MKFITNLLLGILKTLLIIGILSVLFLSLIQKKIPPSFKEANDIFQSLSEVVLTHASLNRENNPVDTMIDKENLVTNRDKLFKEIEKIDPTTNELLPDPTKKQIQPDTSKRDLALLKARLAQTEYKIRLLEYEMKQLKYEYKKIKSSSPNR